MLKLYSHSPSQKTFSITKDNPLFNPKKRCFNYIDPSFFLNFRGPALQKDFQIAQLFNSHLGKKNQKVKIKKKKSIYPREIFLSFSSMPKKDNEKFINLFDSQEQGFFSSPKFKESEAVSARCNMIKDFSSRKPQNSRVFLGLKKKVVFLPKLSYSNSAIILGNPIQK